MVTKKMKASKAKKKGERRVFRRRTEEEGGAAAGGAGFICLKPLCGVLVWKLVVK